MVTKRDVLAQLRDISPFPHRSTRKSVMKTDSTLYYGFAFGKVKHWSDTGVVNSQFNRKYPQLWKVVKGLIHTKHPGFKYNCVQVNKNHQCCKHTDGRNAGKSVIIGLGDYTGGQFVVEGKVNDIRNRWVFFDGRKLHWTNAFKGERYSLVYFTTKPQKKKH